MPAKSPLTPEVLVPRLGDFLVKNNLIDEAQLEQALGIQNQLKEAGQVVLLGDILVSHHFIDRNTLDQAITVQILQLRNALQEANRSLEQKVQLRTQELQIALNKLAELDKLKSNFIANISHELRTPLTHIKGYQELLLAGTMGDLNPEQEDTITVIKKASERLERLIDDLINFTRISRGETELNLAPARFTEIIDKVISRHDARAKEKKITLRGMVEENLPAAAIDEQKITWVISHLVENALKFTPETGMINIEVTTKNNGVLVAVQDTGIGIPQDKFDDIFIAFHQLDGNATRKQGGTGIGLTLAQQIIEAHHSKIRVSSELGKYSRFEFLLTP